MRKIMMCIAILASVLGECAFAHGVNHKLSYYAFGPSVKTVGDAVAQVAKDNHLTINAGCVKHKFNQPLTQEQRMLGPVSVYVALKMLTGTSAFVVNPAKHTLNFDCAVTAPKIQQHTMVKPKAAAHQAKYAQPIHASMSTPMIKGHPKVRVVKPLVQHSVKPFHPTLSPLQQYLALRGYKIRVAWPLIQQGLSASGVKSEVKLFDQSHMLYFGFNHKDKIAAIAPTQKQANALAQQKRGVFYVSAGESLAAVVKRWAGYAHDKLYWLAKYDVRIHQPAAFFGQFGAKNGALEQILKAVANENVNLRAVLHSNHVLTINADNYSPALL